MRKESSMVDRTAKNKRKEITTVMFVENTPFGILVKRLQGCEDRNGDVTNRRVRMVEMGGSQLRHLLPNTDPWAGSRCGRDDCPPCNQGVGQKKRDNCFKRNILYESHCGVCEDRRGTDTVKKRKRKYDELPESHDIYVGETSRSLYERALEHIRDGKAGKEDSHIAKHWRESHPNEECPEFRFKLVRGFKDSLSRQISESVRIDMRGNVLNSKTEYSRCRLPRLGIEKNEEEMRKSLREVDESRKYNMQRTGHYHHQEPQTGAGHSTEVAVDEDELSWNWRKSDLARQLGATEGQEDRPAKRLRRIKGWREHEDNSWGQVELEDTGFGSINSWLLKDKNPEPGHNQLILFNL